jgi:hypothetical protein
LKHLVVGAGATFAEARALGNPVEKCPPLIRDFARKMWDNYTPHPYLEEYLRRLGYLSFDPRDPRKFFFELEDQGVTNVERFMEFVWENRDANFPISEAPPAGYISGLHIRLAGETYGPNGDPPPTFWTDMQYHGIGNALTIYIIQCFHESGVGWRDLALTKSVAGRYGPGDLVLNLNYDTVFEIALEQLGRPFVYSPNKPAANELIVCKPHGSLNLVTNEAGFTFGQPDWLGMPEPQGFHSFQGFVPPRLNKSYAQHPIAKIMLDSIRGRHPKQLAMWGVGLTDSDADLLALYTAWAKRSGSVDIINPSHEVAERAEQLFKCSVRHFSDLSDWIVSL